MQENSKHLRAVLIDCIPPDMSREDADFRMLEAESLVRTYGGVVLVASHQRRMHPHYRTYIGPGKAEEILAEAKHVDANILIVNNELKPAQIYNLSELYRPAHVEVWDRIDLILKIFQKHASTREAKLEIELASVRHMGPRIFGMGMELSRQGGGIGTRGEGETNTEKMKRHLAAQEDKIRAQLADCQKTRSVQMQSRKRKNFKTVGIIGYTNAGKSTLLNALTNKGAYAANKLFATLDTRVGKLYLPSIQSEVLLSDTIGFIQDLPHTLINSFQSTLAETQEADILLHVIDASDPRVIMKMQVVHDVLRQIGVAQTPVIYVCNKADALTTAQKKTVTDLLTETRPLFVSARTGEGLEDLKEVIARKCASALTGSGQPHAQ